jgi:hypothetical protein
MITVRAIIFFQENMLFYLRDSLVSLSRELHYKGGIFPVLISFLHLPNPFKLFTCAVYGRSICYTFLPSKLGADHGLPFKLSALTKGPVLMSVPLCMFFVRGGYAH